jgi:hypothetical protein
LPSFAREEVNVRAVLGRGPGRPNKAQWGWDVDSLLVGWGGGWGWGWE